MANLERSIEISAPPEAVWHIASDPNYMPKLFPDVVSVRVDPPGPPATGQKITIVGKIARRKVELVAETMEVIPNQKLVVKHVIGGFIKSYTNAITLTPTSKGTKFSTSVEYDISGGALGKAVSGLSGVVINRIARKNALQGLKNLKEIAELKEMSTAGS